MQTLTLKQRETPYEINEELKVLRTNIQFSGDDKRVILMTSSFSGEGKSTLSLNLAVSFTELGRKVLYIDTDMRKSEILSHFERTTLDFGLSHYLSGQCNVGDIMCKTNVNGLYVIASVQVPPNPSELLARPRFSALVEACRKTFDYIIVDCAPLGMVVDAAVTAPVCDGVLVVLEAGQVTYRMAQDTVAKIEVTGCPIIGAVLNKVDYSHGSYGYGKYYGRYGKYGKYGRYGKYGYGKYGRYGRYGRYGYYGSQPEENNK